MRLPLPLAVSLALATGIPSTPLDAQEPGARSPAARWQEFQAAHPGSWQVEWNHATGTPEAVFGRGIRACAGEVATLAAAREVAAGFLAEHTALLGLDGFVPVESIAQRVGEVWVMVFDLRWRELPVRGARADLRLRRSGAVALFGAIAPRIPAGFDGVPRIEAALARAIAHRDRGVALPAGVLAPAASRDRLVIWCDVDAPALAPVHLAFEVDVDGGHDGFVGRVWVDAIAGRVLHAVSDRHACGCVARLSAHAHEAAAAIEREHDEADATGDPAATTSSVSGVVRGWVNTGSDPAGGLSLVPLPRLHVRLASGSMPGIDFFTGEDGSFHVLTDSSDPTPTLEFHLAGNRIADVITAQGTELFWRLSFANNSSGHVVTFGSSGAGEIDRAQTTLYWHVDDVSTWAATHLGRSRIALIDSCTATVNDPSSCNAYYTANTLRFLSQGATCSNSAYQSVIRHEWGHALDDVYGGISTRDGISEGNADIVAMFRSGDPVIAPGFYRDGRSPSHLRTGLNTRHFPVVGTVHDMGELWMGCAWDMRARLIASLGATAGEDLALRIILGSIPGNAKKLTSAVREVFVLDDNDADLCNGTPHYAELSAACLARDIPHPVAPCLSAGLVIAYGPACPGSGGSTGLSGNAGASSVAAAPGLPSGKLAIPFRLLRPLPVSGVSILSRSLLPASSPATVTILDHDFGDDAPGSPVTPVGTIAVGTAEGWYATSFAGPPVMLAPMTPYYLVVDAPSGTIAAPVAASGDALDALVASASSGWSGPYPRAYAFRIATPPIPLPHLSTTSAPRAGHTLVMQMHSIPSLTPVVFWVGLSDTLWGPRPLPADLGPLGAPGCAVTASWDLPLVLLSSAVGTAQGSLLVPSDPGIVGLLLYLQGAVIDPAANGFGVTVTNALRIGIGG